MKLAQASVVLTGASGGIGSATARLLVYEGAKVLLVGRSKEVLMKLASELGAGAADRSRLDALVVDITTEAGRAAICDVAQARNVNLLINNAGVPGFGTLASAARADIEAMVNTNLPEEVLWLTMYGEVGWPELGERFVNDYCILAERRDHARALVTPEFVKLLETWPNLRMTKPTLFMLMRGRLYLRMQFDDDLFTLEHAIDAFNVLCGSVLDQAALLAQEE